MFTFKLTDEAGEVTEVKADSRDVLVWEKTSRSNERYVELVTELSMVKLYRLAYIAAKRQGVVTGMAQKDFETAFVLGIETEEVVPTNAGVSNET